MLLILISQFRSFMVDLRSNLSRHISGKFCWLWEPEHFCSHTTIYTVCTASAPELLKVISFFL